MKKQNIIICKKYLDKYQNVVEIFENEKSIKKAITINNIAFKKNYKNATDYYHYATKIYDKYHNYNCFENHYNQIKATHTDIKESVNKLFNDRNQNIYLKEHLLVFANLGIIIKNAVLINQTLEKKNREKYKSWNYYYIGLIINKDYYYLEFDVVSRIDDENHYRLHRLKKADVQSALSSKLDEAD